MDKRHKRREKSKNQILAAIQRLHSGTATHPLHIGIQVRPTKQAVAREAGVSSATLYRFPDLIKSIDNLFDAPRPQAMPRAEQHRRSLLARIAELERQNNLLLAENLRLTREFAAQASPTATSITNSLDQRRARKAGRT